MYAHSIWRTGSMLCKYADSLPNVGRSVTCCLDASDEVLHSISLGLRALGFRHLSRAHVSVFLSCSEVLVPDRFVHLRLKQRQPGPREVVVAELA